MSTEGFADELTLLLDAVAEETQRRASTTVDAISIEGLLAADGEVRQRFVELAKRVREVTGVELALIEWKASESHEPMHVIRDGDQATSGWPLWRRLSLYQRFAVASGSREGMNAKFINLPAA